MKFDYYTLKSYIGANITFFYYFSSTSNKFSRITIFIKYKSLYKLLWMHNMEFIVIVKRQPS
jgi:hypothetical protein